MGTVTRRLVFGDDQSQAADVAWLWINSHDWSGWQIEVITATAPGTAPGDEVHAWDPRHPRELLSAGDEVLVVHEEIAAEPQRALAALTDRDLLVIGPKGRGFRKTMRLGGTSETLMNDPPIPLVIARHGVPTTRALICADGSTDCLEAIDALCGMPWIGQVHVLVATVAERGVDADEVADAVASGLRGQAASVRAEVLAPEGLAVAHSTRTMLLDAAARWEADLIVMGTRGLSGLAAVRAGSIAAGLATQAPCSVLMARAR
jgi:nucleotide-binding universal stress UspA family protein